MRVVGGAQRINVIFGLENSPPKLGAEEREGRQVPRPPTATLCALDATPTSASSVIAINSSNAP
jgi:hypothetical protein